MQATSVADHDRALVAASSLVQQKIWLLHRSAVGAITLRLLLTRLAWTFQHLILKCSCSLRLLVKDAAKTEEALVEKVTAQKEKTEVATVDQKTTAKASAEI